MDSVENVDEYGGISRSYDDGRKNILTSIQPTGFRDGDELRVALTVLVWVRSYDGIRDALANAHREILEGAERGFRDIGEMSQKFADARETR